MNLFKVSRSAIAGGVLASGLVAFASIALAGEVFDNLFDTKTALKQLPAEHPVEAKLVSATQGSSKEEMLALAEQTYIDDIAECERRHPDNKKLCDACIQTAEAKHNFVANRVEKNIPLPSWAFGPVPDPMTSPIAAEYATCDEEFEQSLASCGDDEYCKQNAVYSYHSCLYCQDCLCCTAGEPHLATAE